MSYLGAVEQKSSDIRRVNVTSSTSATHTLTWVAPSEQSLIVTINGVKQQNNYTVSGTTLTLDTPLIVTDAMEVVGILDIGQTNIPADNSITTAMVQDDVITADKLANSINTEIAANTAKVTNATHTGDVTGATALTIAVDAVDIPMLSATGSASASTFLRGDNSWAATPEYDDSGLQDDIALLGFKVASNGSLAKYSLVDQTIDDFQDTSGVDASSSTNEVRDSSGKYYKGETTATPTTTGGTLTTYTDGIEYKVRTFTDEAASDNFVTDIALTADILIVGGGGTGDFAGGHTGGQGGGAGGFKYYSGYAVTAATHAIDVGNRGIAAGGGSSPTRQDGHNSSFGSLIALKGNGADGGSGTAYGSQGAGSGSVTPTPNQGNAYGGQAGGGAAEAGGTDGTGHGGDGYTEGTSTVYDWTLADGTTALFKVNGTTNSYGGGGSGNGQAGGLGGGGSSSQSGGAGGSGSANTGGGGGGGDDGGGGMNRGGHGGTGIVVVRYPSSVAAEGANMTLVSTTTAAQAAPTKGDIVLTYTNGAGSTTLDTDVTAEISADGGSTWTALALGSEGSTAGHNIATSHDVTISSTITAPYNMAYRIKTLNQSASKTTRIQAVSLGWS